MTIQNFANDWVISALTQMSKASQNLPWPPFNFKSDKDGKKFEMQFALAGVKKSDVKVVLKGNVLTVSSPGIKFDSSDIWMHRGFSFKGFERSFDIGKLLTVDRVEFIDGVLSIHLVREDASEDSKELEIHSGYLTPESVL